MTKIFSGLIHKMKSRRSVKEFKERGRIVSYSYNLSQGEDRQIFLSDVPTNDEQTKLLIWQLFFTIVNNFLLSLYFRLSSSSSRAEKVKINRRQAHFSMIERSTESLHKTTITMSCLPRKRIFRFARAIYKIF